MAQDSVLRFQRVFAPSGKTQLLEDVNFEIAPAERVALSGKPLAGKSLILHLAMGLARPNSGSIDGTATQRSNHCGVVFDTVSLLEDLTVRGNLRYFGMLFGMWGRGLRRRIDEVAEGLAAADMLGARVSDLDTAQLRLIDVARALIHRPQLLLIDEHRFGPKCDEEEEMLTRLLNSPLAEGLAVLVARRHAPNLGLVSRRLVIQDGRVLQDGLHAEELAESTPRGAHAAHDPITGVGGRFTAAAPAAPPEWIPHLVAVEDQAARRHPAPRQNHRDP